MSERKASPETCPTDWSDRETREFAISQLVEDFVEARCLEVPPPSPRQFVQFHAAAMPEMPKDAAEYLFLRCVVAADRIRRRHPGQRKAGG